jgi:hypothetical protein
MTARDAGNVVKTMCTKTVAGVEHACHVPEALNPSGVPTPMNLDADGNLRTGALTATQLQALALATAANQVATNAKLDTLIAALTAPATAANQVTASGSLASIDSKVTGLSTDAKLEQVRVLLAGGLAVTMSGAATSALQSTGNTSLSSIDGKLTGVATAANQATATATLASLLSAVQAATPAGTNPIGDVGSASFSASCSGLTLPGTGGTYASGDMVANSATAGSVAALTCVVARYSGGPVTITKARLTSSNTTLTNASFRPHLYTANPTATNGNDGVYLTTLSGHFCKLDISLDVAFSDAAEGSGVPYTGTTCTRVLSATQTIYALIEVRGAYAWTAGQTFTLTLEGYN